MQGSSLMGSKIPLNFITPTYCYKRLNDYYKNPVSPEHICSNIYIYMYIEREIYVYIHIHIDKYLYICTQIYIYIYTRIHLYNIHIYVLSFRPQVGVRVQASWL